MIQFRKLVSLPGFSGSIQPGVAMGLELQELEGTETNMELDVDAVHSCFRSGEDGEEEEEDEDDQKNADIDDTIAALMFLTVDKYGSDVLDVN